MCTSTPSVSDPNSSPRWDGEAGRDGFGARRLRSSAATRPIRCARCARRDVPATSWPRWRAAACVGEAGDGTGFSERQVSRISGIDGCHGGLDGSMPHRNSTRRPMVAAAQLGGREKNSSWLCHLLGIVAGSIQPLLLVDQSASPIFLRRGHRGPDSPGYLCGRGTRRRGVPTVGSCGTAWVPGRRSRPRSSCMRAADAPSRFMT